ncbi:MarR family winged helix-turn-helix transcriptional regulator [Nocardioides sp. MH1]|uniref:MarR family winged helix-turn-helix transcriptional regulator n=1 Tax=Nocardioides sp. MH1 TaxID=3242490 RepID=UPI0035213301
MTTPHVDQLSSDLAIHAARLVRLIRRNLEQPAGIRVLSLLDEHGALGVTALAAADQCSQPTMTGAVARLRDLGWVDTRPNPADARGSLVDLTEAGRRELARIREINARLVAERLAAHPDRTVEELAAAVAVLRAVTTDPSEGASQ